MSSAGPSLNDPMNLEIIKLYGKRLSAQTVVMILSLVFLVTVLTLYSFKFQNQISGFIVIGDYFKAPHIWTEKTWIYKNSFGYDGQFYFYMAHDPFMQGQTFDHLDFPAYRYQRLLYPLTVWLFSLGGRPPLIPWMMVIVNGAAYLLGVWTVLRLLALFGRSPWFALVYATCWGFLLSILRCLPEPMAVTWVMVALYFHYRGRLLLQLLFLSLSALTQETTLLVSWGFLLHRWFKRDHRQAFIFLIPSWVYLLWQGMIFQKFGVLSFVGGTQNFGPPLWGWLEKVIRLSGEPWNVEKLAEGIYLLFILFLFIRAFVKVGKEIDPLTLTFAGYALMAVFYNQLIWVEPWSYARATLGLLTFHVLIATKEGRGRSQLSLLPIPLVFFLSLVSMKLV